MAALFTAWLSGDDMEPFATGLREAREARKLTQMRLSELLTVDRRVWDRREHCAAVPQLDTVARIAQVLQVSVDSLVWQKAAKS